MSIINNKIFKGKLIIFLSLFIIVFFIVPILTKKNIIKRTRKLESDLEILVKIHGSGEQQIINQIILQTLQIPDIYYLNGDIICWSCKKEENLSEYENILQFKFSNLLYTYNIMFKDLKNLIEVNFSNFDSTEITFMREIFYGCQNLKYINISKNNNNNF